MKPNLCRDCLRENRIAAVNGPTCPHRDPNGSAWFPTDWATMHEPARVAWIKMKEETP